MQISAKGIELLKQFEGVRKTVYKDSAGLPTIGVGHLITAEEKAAKTYEGRALSEDEVEALLRTDLARIEAGVRTHVKAALTQQQYDALVCFTFNVGLGALALSTLLKKVNAGDASAADEFLKWDKARNPKTGKLESVKGLTSRRQAERALWLS